MVPRGTAAAAGGGRRRGHKRGHGLCRDHACGHSCRGLGRSCGLGLYPSLGLGHSCTLGLYPSLGLGHSCTLEGNFVDFS